MKKSIGSLLFACLLACVLFSATSGAGKAKAFDRKLWEASYAAAYEQKDPALLREHISRLYNVAGGSREDMIKRATAEFEKYDKIVCQYEVLEVKPSDADDHTVVKARSLVKALPAGKTDFVTLSQGESFDSLVFEEGHWKMYDTVSAEGTVARANAFACPFGGTNFRFSEERGDWPAWSAAEQGELTAPQRTIKGTGAFNEKRWEAQVKAAWDSKNMSRIAVLYSPLYNHLGISKGSVLKEAERVFQEYKSINTRYRVIDFRYLSDSRLISIKAILEMTGVPKSGGESTTILAVMGYASLQYNNGQWQMYATQLAH
ncbi:MAG: hypothetical protein ACJ74G_22630 [Blastocatellia bacterium]